MFAAGDRLFLQYPRTIPGVENDPKAGGLFHWHSLKPASIADVREQDAIIVIQYDPPGDHYGYLVETGPDQGRYLWSEDAHTAALDEKLQRERQAEVVAFDPDPVATPPAEAPVAELDPPSAVQPEAPAASPAPALPQQPSVLTWLNSFRVH